MADGSSTRRDLLRGCAALLAAGAAGCEEILTGDAPTRTGRPTATRTPRSNGVEPTPPVSSPTPRSSTDTPGRPAVLTRVPRDDGTPEDLFGFSAAVGSDAAFVGAPGTGVVYVLAPSGSEWTRTATLTPEAGSGDALGVSLALAGDTLLVGARAPRPDVSNSAHVFRRTDGAWRRAARLTPGDGSPIDGFGSAVAPVEAGAVVGAPGATDPEGRRTGAAYVFRRANGAWNRAAKLVPSDIGEHEAFGVSLATGAGTLLVGAPGPSGDGDGTGSVYAFERLDGTWRRTAKLVPGTAAPAAFFGSGLAIADGTAFVGAPGDDRRDGIASGVTYVLERSGPDWRATAGLTPGYSDAGNRFGATVDLAGETALVGASLRGTGSAYAFDRSGGPWRRRAELLPDPPPVNGGFGSAIAVTEETALIGAPFVFTEDPGAAYAADLAAL